MAVPETFQAGLLHEKCGKHTVSSRSLAPLEAGEVAIKITATAINPVDWKIRDYGIFIQNFPAVLGSDAAGEIAAVGPDVAGFEVGERVFFQGIIGNIESSTFQQYCKMPASLVSKTPKNISDEEAAGIQLATVAGVTGFYDKSGRGLPAPWDEGGEQVGKGKAIIVLGGSSSVGQYAIQLARLSGFERIITNASATHVERLTKLGAHVVLDRSKAQVEDFKAAVGDLPLEFVFDSISLNPTQTLGVQVLQATNTEGSSVVLVGQPDNEAKELGESKEPKVELRSVLGLGSSPALRYLSEPMAKNLGGEDGYVAKGLFVPNRVTVVPGGLASLDKALDKNREGVSGEKVILRPFDS